MPTSSPVFTSLVLVLVMSSFACSSSFKVSSRTGVPAEICDEKHDTDCQNSVDIDDSSFKITGIEVTADGLYTIRWQNSDEFSKFDLIIARDQACRDVVVNITSIPTSSQSVTVQGDGHYVCVFAQGVKKRVAATNNGVAINRLLVATPQPVTSTPTPTPTPTPVSNSSLNFNFASAVLAEGSSSFSVTFAADDSNDNALITLYYKFDDNTGCSAGGISGWTQIVSGLTEDNTTSYNWNTSSLGGGTYYICGRITDNHSAAVYTLSANSLRVNEAPTVAITSPGTGTTVVGQTQTYDITWTDSDADDNAAISLYYSSSNGGACASGSLISNSPTENDQGALGSFTWQPTSVPAGTYYICAVISDGVNTPVNSAWSDGQITINAKPSFAWVSPNAETFVMPGGDFELSWTMADSDDDAQLQISYGNTYSATCSGYTNLGAAISESSGITTYDFTTTRNSDFYYFCATVTDGYNTVKVAVEAAKSFVIYRNCLWEGTNSTTWSDAGNWSNCNSVAPARTDRPIIPSAPANQPSVTATTTIAGFGQAIGGGTVTVNANVILTLNLVGRTFASSVTFKGQTATCTTCLVWTTSKTIAGVVNDATLTLEAGIILQYGSSYGAGWVQLGDGVEAGHFRAVGGVTEDEWPQFYAIGYSDGLKINSPSGNPSRIYVDGLKMLGTAGHNSFKTMHLDTAFQIDKLDNVIFDLPAQSPYKRTHNIEIATCADAVFNDVSWDNLTFVSGGDKGIFDIARKNVVANSDCSGKGPITITASGLGSGSPFEDDPANIINWVNDSVFTCTWTGNNGISWNDAGNWSNCNNNRGGYPTQHDYVLIPSTPNQPTVSSNTFFKGFAVGVQGGSITIAEDTFLAFSGTDGRIVGDITLRGATPGCTTCLFAPYRDLYIVDAATLTLDRGITVGLPTDSYVYVGDGVTPGHLKTAVAGAPFEEWPIIETYDYYFHGIAVQGGSGAALSSIDIDGLRIGNILVGTGGLNLIDYYDVVGLDHVSFSLVSWNTSASNPLFVIRNCANGLFQDRDWTGFDFAAVVPNVGFNIDIAGCASLNPAGISISPLGGTPNSGYGETFAKDPDSVLRWN